MIQTDNREVQGEFLTQREYIVYKLLIFLPAIDKTEYVWYYIIKERPKKYIYKDIQWWKPGDAIRNHYIDKVGIIFYEFPSWEEMTNVVNNIKNYASSMCVNKRRFEGFEKI